MKIASYILAFVWLAPALVGIGCRPKLCWTRGDSFYRSGDWLDDRPNSASESSERLASGDIGDLFWTLDQPCPVRRLQPSGCDDTFLAGQPDL